VLRFDFPHRREGAARVLCVGAHSDDIEIGCGGTLLRLLAEGAAAEVHWVVLGSSGQRDGEALTSAENFLAAVAHKNIVVQNFRDGFFPYVGGAIKEFFEDLKHKVAPDVIFTHYRHDLHQDHRLVSELTWNTYRDHLILEYEVVKYDGDLGAPNLFVHLDEAVCQRKVALLMEGFQTQRGRAWFTPDAFLSLMRIRGIESKAPGRYAEAFYCRKLVI
jgi:LmbE family N-acetylglucosaminyl deacetylase